MNDLDALFVPLFAFTVMLWAGLSIWVVGGRLLHEVRGRVQRRVRQQLEDQLASLPAESRVRAAHEILARQPRHIVDRIVADPALPAWLVEACAQHVLVRRGVDKVLRDAEGKRRNPDVWRRISALRVLVRIRHAAIHGLLERALLDEESDVATAAIALLGALEDEEAARILIFALRDQRPFSSRIATQLEHFPDHVVRPLRSFLRHPNPNARYWAAVLMARPPGPPGIDADLARLANDPYPIVRKAAIQALGRLGGGVAAATAMRLLQDPTGFVRAHAVRALGALGRTERAGQIATLLADRDWWVRLAAKETLADMGQAVWRDVAAQLDSADAFARDGAAEVLQNMGVLHDLAMRAGGAGIPDESVRILRKATEAGGRRFLEAALAGSETGARTRIEALLHGNAS